MSESRCHREWRIKHRDIINARKRERRANDDGERNKKECEYRAKNIERYRAYSRKYRKKHKERCREAVERSHRKHPENARHGAWKRVGIDMEFWSYDRFRIMFQNQHGKCLGCERGLAMSKRELVGTLRLANVDHDHSNGRVRGLLCRQCNQVLGNVGDNAETLVRLADYLRRFSEA